MKTRKLTELDKYLAGCINTGRIPGCVLWVGNMKETFYFKAHGYARMIGTRVKMKKTTVFDLASLTKPLATANAVMLLEEEGNIRLTDKLEKFLPAFRNKPNGKKTIKELLIHTAGIPAWYPLYLVPAEKRLDFLARGSIRTGRVVYSCLGYIILSNIIEKVTGTGLHSFCRERIFDKLNLKKTMFCPSRNVRNIAPTELGNEHERIKASDYGDASVVKWRKYLIQGEAHDGNCFYGFGGVSGNAGLFSNIQELIALMRSYLSGGIVKKSTLKNMVSDHTGGSEPRGLGWLLNPYPHSLPARTFGHTGFTGVLVAVDPKPGMIIILLANAVHPKVRLGIMPKIRKKIARLIADAGLSR